MRLIGRRFSTWIEHSLDMDWIIKSMDLVPPDREPSICYRDYLGFRLGARLGLAVPETRLDLLETYGRCSVQCCVPGAREVTSGEQQSLCASPTGLRIMLLDLLCRNRDRRLENLLLVGGVYFPIDFNVAFRFDDRPIPSAESSRIIMNWLGIEGALTTAARGWDALSRQVESVQNLLSEHFLTYAISSVGQEFLSGDERTRVLGELLRRRQALPAFLGRWWQETAIPLQAIPREVSDDYCKSQTRTRQT